MSAAALAVAEKWGHEFPAPLKAWLPWAALSCSLLLAGLLAACVFSNTTRAEPVRAQGDNKERDGRETVWRERMQHEMQLSYQSQTLLNTLLHVSLEEVPMQEILERFIEVITSIPWFEFESKGGIFLVEDDPAVLVLKAQHRMDEQVQTSCARLQFGRCLCGRAAASGRIEFADSVDNPHEIHCDNISRHGHYCVPILFSDKVLGVITLYLKEGHDRDEKEEQFLTAASDVLAGVVQRRRIEGERLKLERQLLQSEKMASVGQLAAGMAHEIHNPAWFVSSNLDTLKEYQDGIGKLLRLNKELVSGLQNAELPSACANQFDRIQSLQEEVDVDFMLDDIPGLINDCIEGTERIKKIVMDLKDYAHPGEDKPRPADINKGLDSSLNIVWNELKYKAKVTKDYGDLPDVQCYPQELNQVFMNLLVNAAQAIENEGEIHISTRAAGGNVEIKIGDTGSGIPRENLSRIFDPFFTTKEVGKGTGLGLNVAYNIIRKHKGTISVESEVGKGSIFTVQIPASGGLVE